jgi:hypothetical protein
MDVLPATAVDPLGGAVVAWQRATDWALDAVARSGPGPFGAPVTLSRPVRLGLPSGVREFFDAFAPLDREGEHDSNDSGPDNDARNPRIVLSQGRALVTWAAPLDRDGVWELTARSATLPLDGGAAELRAHGAGVREAEIVTPLLAADGAPAVMWRDETEEEADDRLHVAVEGLTDPPAIGPRVTVRAGPKRVLRAGEALVLRVTCSAACDVRAQTGPGYGGASDRLSLTRAGTGRLRLQGELRPLATLRGGPVRVHVRSAAPGAATARTQTLTLRLRRRPGPPLPRVTGAVARRDGDDVVVTWRTTRDAEPENLFVFTPEPLGYAEPDGGPRRFRARLRDVPSVRSVSIWVSDSSIYNVRRTLVRVR